MELCRARVGRYGDVRAQQHPQRSSSTLGVKAFQSTFVAVGRKESRAEKRRDAPMGSRLEAVWSVVGDLSLFV